MVELVVDRLVAGGAGLAQLDGLKVFVPFAAPQEKVKARLVTRKRDYAVARIEEILEPSPLRVKPPCPFYGECGGCQLQHLSYEGQLVVKKLIVNDALQRLGRVFVPVNNISSPSEPWRYRNKTQYPVGLDAGGKHKGTKSTSGERAPEFKVGFYRRESHNLLDIPSCLLHPEVFDRLRSTAVEVFRAAGETAYFERSHKGNVRHLVFRTSGQDVLAVVVTRTESLKQAVVEQLAVQPEVTGVVQSVNPDRTNRILGDRTKTLSGRGELEFGVLDKTFRVSARSFFQVNSRQAEHLCRKVLRFAAPTGSETVLDLYSGVGMLSLVLAGFVARVIGCEIDSAAIEDARYNAGLNTADNVQFTAGNVDDVIGSIDRADVVVLDPPRKGCSPETVKRIAGLKPSRVVYVSCNPATLARDLRLFDELGYETTDVEPVDMFPQTCHVEAVVRLCPRM